MTSSLRSNNVLLTESVRAGINLSEYLEGVLNCDDGGLRVVESYPQVKGVCIMLIARTPFSLEQS